MCICIIAPKYVQPEIKRNLVACTVFYEKMYVQFYEKCVLFLVELYMISIVLEIIKVGWKWTLK